MGERLESKLNVGNGGLQNENKKNYSFFYCSGNSV